MTSYGAEPLTLAFNLTVGLIEYVEACAKSSLSIFKYFLEKFKLYKSFKHISKKHSKSILDYNKVTSEITDKFIKEYDLL